MPSDFKAVYIGDYTKGKVINMGKRIELTGQTINGIHVDSFAYVGGGKSKKAYWNCTCSCGNKFVAESLKLRTGHTRSCGCYRRKITGETHRTHGATSGGKKQRLYSIWRDMRKRCRNKNTTYHKDYVDRGIVVCDEWQKYETFRDWALENGYKDNLSIERINVNGNYEPNNCKWITISEQQLNKRNTHYITYEGITKPMCVWCRDVGLPYSVVENRINRLHWSVEDALKTPVRR